MSVHHVKSMSIAVSIDWQVECHFLEGDVCIACIGRFLSCLHWPSRFCLLTWAEKIEKSSQGRGGAWALVSKGGVDVHACSWV